MEKVDWIILAVIVIVVALVVVAGVLAPTIHCPPGYIALTDHNYNKFCGLAPLTP